MSGSSEGNRKASEWKPQTPRARASLRDCTIEPTQYSNTMQSPYNHSFSSNNSSMRSANLSAEAWTSEETDEDSDCSEYLQESLHLEQTSPISPRVRPRQTQSAATSPSSSSTRRSNINTSLDRLYNTHRQHQRHSASISRLILVPLGIVLCMLTVGGLYINQDNKIVRSGAVDDTLGSLMRKIRARFRNQQEELWEHVYSGIHEAVLHPGKPGIILLYGSETDTVNCLANSLGELSGVVLGTDEHLALRPKDFKPDVGEVIHDFRSKISRTKAVVVEDLLSVNSEAFKAFHNFCDRENPLVGQAVYIITMITSGTDGSGSDLSIVERKLAERFGKSIKKDILDPLITRVTDGAVLRVAPETLTVCDSF